MEDCTAKAPTGWSAAKQHEQELRKHALGEAIRSHHIGTLDSIVTSAEAYLKFIKAGDGAA